MQGCKSLSIGALSCRGLDDNFKRRDLFAWMKKKKFDICLLQETHSIETSNRVWEMEWGYRAFFSNHTNRSRGAAILLNNSVNYEIHRKYIEDSGRFVILDVTIQNKRITLTSIYAPNDDDPAFFQELEEQIEKYENNTIIIGGDWNVVQNFEKDTYKYSKLNNPKAQEKISEMENALGIVDIWRARNMDEKKYTWRGPNSKMSRLDYFLVSEDIADLTCKTDIKPGYKSDHSLITLELSLINQPKGRGTWKFNNSLLRDKDYVNIVKQTIRETTEQYSLANNDDEEDPYEIQFNIDDQLFFEMLKLNIRSKTIPYAAKMKRERVQREQTCEKEVEKLYIELSKNPSDNNKQKYEAKQTELQEIREPIIHGAIARAKARWYKEGEKCTNYFCSLEKKHYEEKLMKKIVMDDHTEIYEQEDIIKAQKNYYENLYTSRETNTEKEQEATFLNKDNPQNRYLTEEEAQSCEGKIKYAECTQVVKDQKNNKSPGSDGYTSEFYKFFWRDLAPFLIRSANHAYEAEKLSITQRQGTLICLPKPGKPKEFLKNWRPISLLNVDYKIISAVIANRLKKVLNSIVSETQKGFIKGRYIGECTRLVHDIIENTRKKDIAGMILLIDFEKAFDSVNHSFIQKCLKFWGFKDSLRHWVSTLYTDISSCVSYNGHCSTWFPIQRGVRQGDPLSPYLFIIVTECLSSTLKNDASIKGISIDNTEYLISQYADDTDLFLDEDEKSLERCFEILDDFAICSGLKVNVEKTECVDRIKTG